MSRISLTSDWKIPASRISFVTAKVRTVQEFARGRTVKHITAGALTIGLIVSIGACSSRPDTSRPHTQTHTTQVPASTDSTITVTDAWSVQVPADAVPANASMTISTDLPDIPDVTNEIARAEITLSSGQPRKPLTFTYHLTSPVPERSAVYLLGRSASAAELADRSKAPPAAAVVEAQLSADRTTATAAVPHLSACEQTDRVGVLAF